MRQLIYFTEQELKDLQDGKEIDYEMHNDTKMTFVKEKPKPEIIPTCHGYVGYSKSSAPTFLANCVHCKRAYNAGTVQRETFRDLYEKREGESYGETGDDTGNRELESL